MSATARTIDIDAIKAAVDLRRIVAETVSLHRTGGFTVGLCPFHPDKGKPNLTVWADHYHCFRCLAHGDAIDWLIKQRGMGFREAAGYLAGGRFAPALQGDRPQRHANDDDAESARRKAASARRIWSEATAPTGSPAQTYLHSRGLELPEPFFPDEIERQVIRFHPSCPCGDLRLPAMIALMTDPLTGEQRGIHRTFLKPDGSGKADIETPKMMLGTAGVIRLCERVTNGLGIAEGIETALAVAQRIQWGPVWATGSDSGIADFPLLVETTLHIFVDHDAAGIRAAGQCKARWVEAGLEVWIHTPEAGEDWADAARRIAP